MDIPFKCISIPQVPSMPAGYGVNKLLSGTPPTSPPIHDNMSMASGYSTVTGTVIGKEVINTQKNKYTYNCRSLCDRP